MLNGDSKTKSKTLCAAPALHAARETAKIAFAPSTAKKNMLTIANG